MRLRDPDLLRQPIIEYLADGERPSWEIEDMLAMRFHVTEAERAQRQPNSRVPVFTNDVAFALKKLVEARRITRIRSRRAPNGGMRGVYLRIPMKPAGYSDLKAATHSDFKAATIPI
jgi:Mrr N-terminal domain